MKTILKNNWLPLALCAAIIIIYLLAPMAHGQPTPQQLTNVTPYAVSTPDSIVVTNLETAINAVVHYALQSLSGVSWGTIIISVYLGIKGLRNRTPLGSGTIGNILGLLNLEAKPIPSEVQAHAEAKADEAIKVAIEKVEPKP